MLGAPHKEQDSTSSKGDFVESIMEQLKRPPITAEFVDKVAMALAVAVESELDIPTISKLLWRLPAFHDLSESNQDRYIEAFGKAIELKGKAIIDEFLSTEYEIRLSPENIFYGLVQAQKEGHKETIEQLGVALAAAKATLGEDLDVAHDLSDLCKTLIQDGHIDLVKVILEKHFPSITQYHQDFVRFCLEIKNAEMFYYFIAKDIQFEKLSLDEVISGLLDWLKSLKKASKPIPGELVSLLALIVNNTAAKITEKHWSELLNFLQVNNCIRELRELLTAHANMITRAQVDTCLVHALESEQAAMVAMLVEHAQTNKTVWNKMPWSPSFDMFVHVIDKLKLQLLECLLETQFNPAFEVTLKRALNYAAANKRLEAVACIFDKVPQLSFADRAEVVKAAPEEYQGAITRLIDEQKAKMRAQMLLEKELEMVRSRVSIGELNSGNIDERLHSAIATLEREKQSDQSVEASLRAIETGISDLQLDEFRAAFLLRTAPRQGATIVTAANESASPKDKKRIV